MKRIKAKIKRKINYFQIATMVLLVIAFILVVRLVRIEREVYNFEKFKLPEQKLDKFFKEHPDATALRICDINNMDDCIVVHKTSKMS